MSVKVIELVCCTMEPLGCFVHTDEEWPGPTLPVHLELIGKAWFDERSDVESRVSVFMTEKLVEEIIQKLSKALERVRGNRDADL